MTDPSFAKPAGELVHPDTGPIPNTRSPASGYGLTLNDKGVVPGVAMQTPTLPTAACNSLTALTTTAADVPGATFSMTTASPSALVVILAVFDFQISVAGAGVCVGTIVVDSSTQAPQAIWQADTIVSRGTCSAIVPVTLSKGDHTLKLQAKKTINAGTANVVNQDTTITALVFDYI